MHNGDSKPFLIADFRHFSDANEMMEAEKKGTPAAKDLFFYLLLLIFISHNFVHIFYLATGRQPIIDGECPLSLAFSQAPLLFDRETTYCDRSEVTLNYPGERKTFPVLDAVRKFAKFSNRNAFTRWPTYLRRPNVPRAVLRYYFCEFSPTYTGLMPDRKILPDSVEWNVTSPALNTTFFHFEVKCKH